MRTWKTLGWRDKPIKTQSISLICPHCATDAEIDVGHTEGAMIIAAIGLGVIFDPPSYTPRDNFMPDRIQCRKCRRVYDSMETVNVREVL